MVRLRLPEILVDVMRRHLLDRFQKRVVTLGGYGFVLVTDWQSLGVCATSGLSLWKYCNAQFLFIALVLPFLITDTSLDLSLPIF